MHPKHGTYLIAVVLILLALACSLSPQQTVQPTQDQQLNQSAVETQVAQTMAAQQGNGQGNGGAEQNNTIDPNVAAQTQAAATVAAQGALDTAVAQTQAAPNAMNTAVAQTLQAQNAMQTSVALTVAAQAPNPTATFTPTQDYQPPIGVQALNLGGPDELYEFDIDQLMYDYTGANDRAYFENSKFVFAIDDPIGFDIWTYSWIEDTNYYVEVTIQMPTCSGNDRAGIIFRTPQNTYDAGYVFQISCDGHFRLTNWDGAVHNDIAIWQGNNAINAGSGAINRIGVFVDGSFIRLFVNAVEVGAYNDQTYLGIGKIGLVIGVGSTHNFEVLFDDFAYWDLP